MKKCQSCNREITENARFCPYCGVTQQEESTPKIRYCSKCGEELKDDYISCPKCGWELKKKEEDPSPDPDPGQWQGTGSKTGTTPSDKSSVPSLNPGYPQGILKVLCIVMGAVYAYMALTYTPYLSYYDAADKAWGVFMIIACVWYALISFVIAFRCKKQYGIHLFYALTGGGILKCVLHIIELQKIARYEYWSNSFTEYLPVIFTVLTIVACWYAMKKEEMLFSNETRPFGQIVKEIPKVLHMVLAGNGTTQSGGASTDGTSVGNTATGGTRKPGIRPNPHMGAEGAKILSVICGNLYLIFGVLYTINIAYEVFASFAFYKLITGFLSIMICIAICMIYSSGRNGILDGTGFSIVNGVTLVRFIVRIVIWSILFLTTAAANTSVTGLAAFIILVVACLDLYYWWSIKKLFYSMRQNAKGLREEVTVGIYPIIILTLNAVAKALFFSFASYMQYTVNNITGTLNQYGEEASGLAGLFTDWLGLGYGYGQSQVSDWTQSFLNPINQWLQGTFGFGENPLIMGIAIAIPVLEILMLIKLRSFVYVKPEE